MVETVARPSKVRVMRSLDPPPPPPLPPEEEEEEEELELELELELEELLLLAGGVGPEVTGAAHGVVPALAGADEVALVA